jgi:hypothetical protein
VRTRRLAPRSVRFLTVLLLAGVIGGVAPVTAGAARARPPGVAASVTVRGQLFGVAAASAKSAWAVGDTVTSTGTKTLILHWNGTAWT